MSSRQLHVHAFRQAFWLLPFFLMNSQQQLPAQPQAGWPVKWSANGKEIQGVLAWNNQEKTAELRTPDGKKTAIEREFTIFPQSAPTARRTVQEYPDRTVAILGFQERLSGRLHSIFQQPGQLQWSWPGGLKSEPWNTASAAAWLFHPDVTVLASGLKTGPAKAENVADTPSGGKPDELKAPLTIKARPSFLEPGTGRLWQMAFFEPEAPVGTSIIQAAARIENAAEFQEFLHLKYNAAKTHWELVSKPEQPLEHTPIARKPGWHFVSVLAEKGRTRVCIDETVLAESRVALLPDQPVAEFQVSTEIGQSRSIDAFGYYAFQSVPPVVQRPIQEDLVQIDGGHELIGENRIAQDQIAALRAFLPRSAPAVGRWASGQVARVTFRGLSAGVWNLMDENDYLGRMGLFEHPPKGFDRVEGAIEALSPTSLTLGLSQGGSIQIPLNEIESLSLINARGLRTLEARPHHLGDEIDLKVTPPEPEGNKLSITFENSQSESALPTELAVDVLQVLGANIAPFIDSIARGELVTEVWLNEKNLGTLNSQIKDRNETPRRLYFDVPQGTLVAGPNRLEFRQKGQKNDPNYLDDLSILGVRLYRK